MDSEMLTVTVGRLDDAIVVRPVGEIDGRSTSLVTSALVDGCGMASTSEVLVIDLTEVTHLSPEAVPVLVSAQLWCDSRRIPLRVVATQPTILRTLKRAQADRVLCLVGSVADATEVDEELTG